jgi:hypothetical protein
VACDGRGDFKLTECPTKCYRQPGVHDVYRAVRFAESGVGLPEAGGTNDQPAAFIDAMAFIQGDESRLKRAAQKTPRKD